MLSRLLIIVVCIALGACAQFSEHSSGLKNNTLTDCPAWPRCVSSLAGDAEKRIAPYQLKAPIDDNWQKLVTAVSQRGRTSIVNRSPHYLHAEVISPWGWYTDDLELLLDPTSGRVDVRSSGRIGYYDFDVNRDRVEALRAALMTENLIKDAD